MINKKLWGLFMGENKRSVVPFAIIVICALITIVALIWGITETVNAKKLKSQIVEIESENRELKAKLGEIFGDDEKLLVIDNFQYYSEKSKDCILYYNVFMTIAKMNKYLGLSYEDIDIDAVGEQMLSDYSDMSKEILLGGELININSEQYKKYESYYEKERDDVNRALLTFQCAIDELSTQ